MLKTLQNLPLAAPAIVGVAAAGSLVWLVTRYIRRTRSPEERERRRRIRLEAEKDVARGRRWRATVAGAAVLLLGAIAFRQVSPLSGTPRAWTSQIGRAHV